MTTPDQTIPPAPSAEVEKFRTRIFWAGFAAITLVSWLLREYFIGVTQVDVPIRGDIVQYVHYAWNLLHHATFSMAPPSLADPVPDAFRGPGYPLFLAVVMALGGDEGGWYPLALHAQAALGAGTVALTMLCARQIMPGAAALLAGLLLAFWPHHVAATGALLSEVFQGFVLIGAIWASLRLFGPLHLGWAVGAALAWSLAALTSPVLWLGPLIVSTMLLICRLREPAIAVALVSVLVAGVWGARNAGLEETSEPGRGVINFVQGSWPLYHDAYNSRFAHEMPVRILRAMDEEVQLVHRDPIAGLSAMADRMAAQPWDYVWWYAIHKPYLLWDWNIRIGAGEVYFLEVTGSPLEANKALAAAVEGLRLLNPVFFFLALAAVVACVLPRRLTGLSSTQQQVLQVLGATFIALTAAHVVFQAEPRYSIPYRSLQVVLVAAALVLLGRLIGLWKKRRTEPAD